MKKAGSTAQRLSNEELSELYPKAKTYDQRLADQQLHEIRVLARQPRHLALSTATRLFIVAGLGALFLSLAPAILFFNIFAGAFAVTLCAIIVLGIGKWQTSEVSSHLYRKGLDGTGFLTFHLLALTPIMIVALYFINTRIDWPYPPVFYVVLFSLHFLLIRSLIRYLLRRQ